MGFVNRLKKLLNLKLAEFISRSSELLPQIAIVHEETSMDRILKLIEEGYSFIVVIDDLGEFQGIITPEHIVAMIGRSMKRVVTPFASIATSLRRVRVGPETIGGLRAIDLVHGAPTVYDDEIVEHAVERMDREGVDYVVVIEKRSRRPRAVVTMRTIVEAAKKLNPYDE